MAQTHNKEDLKFEVAIDKEEVKKRLTEEQYKITQEADTENAFTGKYDKFKETGEYTCIVCGHKMFDSTKKFDSGCGWPAFYDTVDESAVKYVNDDSLGEMRIEVVCSKCGAHMGHVFDDAPAWTKTGVRYCINSASIQFKPEHK